jgi:hypothetical protein
VLGCRSLGSYHVFWIRVRGPKWLPATFNPYASASSRTWSAPVVVADDLELGIAGVGQDLEGAGHVELVVGEQVANGEQRDADAVERGVTALAEA